MTRRLWPTVAATVLALSIVVAAAGTALAAGGGGRHPGGAAATTAAQRRDRVKPALSLLEQSGWVTEQHQGQFVIHLRVSGPGVARDKVGVTVYRRLTNYTYFRETLANRRPTYEATPEVLQSVSSMPSDGAGGAEATFTVAVNPQQQAAGTIPLYLTNAGVYPVQAVLYDSAGAPITELTTHLVWAPVPAVTATGSKLRVALVVPLAAPVSADSSGRPQPLPAATSRSLDSLIAELARHPAVALTLDPLPQTLDALAAGGATDVQALHALASVAQRPSNQVVASPYVPLRMGSLAGAGLTADIASQLQLGAATDAARLGVDPKPGTWVAAGRLRPTTAGLLAQQGFSRLVVPAEAVKPPYSYTTLARPLVVGGRSGPRTLVLRADPNLAAHFVNGRDELLAAHQFLAELAMIQFEEPGLLRGVTVIVPPSWNPDPAFLRTVLRGLTNNPLLEPVTADTLLDSVPVQAQPAGSAAASFTPAAPGRPLAAAPAILVARRQIQAASGLLPPGDHLPAQLNRALLVAESASLSDARRAAVVAAVSETVLRQVAGITIPRSVSITLTARQGRIPITITRTVPYAARIRIVLQSEKVAFRSVGLPNGECTPTAGSETCILSLVTPNTTIKVPLVTRTSGVFPLQVRVESPDGALTLVKSTYTLRSTAASGVGLILLIGAALFLVVWWIRNLRDGRRNRDLVPSFDNDGDAVDLGSDSPPDAEANLRALPRLDQPDAGEGPGRTDVVVEPPPASDGAEPWFDDPVIAGFFASGPPDYPALGWVGGDPSGSLLMPTGGPPGPNAGRASGSPPPGRAARRRASREVRLFDQDDVDGRPATTDDVGEPPRTGGAGGTGTASAAAGAADPRRVAPRRVVPGPPATSAGRPPVVPLPTGQGDPPGVASPGSGGESSAAPYTSRNRVTVEALARAEARARAQIVQAPPPEGREAVRAVPAPPGPVSPATGAPVPARPATDGRSGDGTDQRGVPPPPPPAPPTPAPLWPVQGPAAPGSGTPPGAVRISSGVVGPAPVLRGEPHNQSSAGAVSSPVPGPVAGRGPSPRRHRPPVEVVAVADDHRLREPQRPSTSRATSRGASMSRNTMVMAAGTLLSRVTGFGRTLALAYAFGIARIADVYNLANTVPNILYDLLVGGVLSATLIPVFVEQLNRRDGDEQEGARAISAILTTVGAVLVGMTVIFWVIAPLIIRLYLVLNHSAGVTDQRVLGTSLLRLFVPQLFFLGGIALTTALYNARNQFKAPAFSPVLNNLVVIVAILLSAHIARSVELGTFRHDSKAIAILGLGTTAGYVLQFVIQLPALRRSGVRLRPVWAPRHPAVRTVLGLSGWMFGAVLANQISLYVIYIVADRHSGGVTAFQNAYQFFLLPYAIFAVSIASVITPDLADRWSGRDVRAFRARIASGLRVTLAILVPAAVGYVLIARSFIDVLLRYGHVTAAGAHLTGSTLVMFAVGLPGFSAFLLLMRAYQSMQDTRSMFWLYVFENGVTLVLALALYPSLGVKGLALGWSAAYSIATVAALAGLSRRTGGLEGVRTVVSLIKVSIATVAMAVVVAGVTKVIGGGSDFRLAARIIGAVVCGAGVYLLVGRLVGLRELRLAGLRRS